jgi:hypothetical protein
MSNKTKTTFKKRTIKRDEVIIMSDYDRPILSVDVSNSFPYHHSHLTVGEEMMRGRLTQ